MSRHTTEKKVSLNTTKDMTKVVSTYLELCIQCHRCLDVCPVTKGKFSIKELNQATKQGQQVPSVIRTFAFHCMQCGKCVPVCPVNIRRDYMVRHLKYKERHRKPYSYRRYLFVKGPGLTGVRGVAQKLYVAYQKTTTRDLACFMEKTPQKSAEVLFYPGCYLYSKKTIRQTLRLLDHLGCSYSILGGVTACCGAPHLLQGEFDQADHCLELLHRKIKAVDPRIVITACAECFEAVELIRKTYHEHFEVLSVVQFLQRNSKMLPSRKIRRDIAIFDSCRFQPQSLQGQAARAVIARYGTLVDKTALQNTTCCFQWNHGHDPFNASRRQVFLRRIKKSTSTLACTCLTCYEELKKTYTDVEIINVEDLVAEALEVEEEGKRTP